MFITSLGIISYKEGQHHFHMKVDGESATTTGRFLRLQFQPIQGPTQYKQNNGLKIKVTLLTPVALTRILMI